MGFFKNLINKIRHKKAEKTAEKIQETTQIAQVDQKTFDEGLKKSGGVFKSALDDLVKEHKKVDAAMLESIEEMLIGFDVGTGATTKIMQAIEDEIKFQNVEDASLVKQIIIDKIFVYYIQDTIIDNGLNLKQGETNVILVSGVNGVGKTTSIAKIAHYLLDKGMKVCLVAGDTFRAGAVEQLNIWAQRLNIQCFKPKFANQDPASVIYEGVKWANENKIDVVLCDTSGRLQNKINLMNELKKIDGVIKKFNPNQPCESLLVLDATTGQSGIAQAKAFQEVTKLTGIILTKMDSTSKGGIILAVKDNFNIPVKFIGLGETYNDLQPFDIEKFVIGLTKDFNFDKE